MPPNLDTLPEEMFLMICSYLDTKFICQVLVKVCVKFQSIFEDDIVWRLRLKKTELCYIKSDWINNDNANFKEACLNYDIQSTVVKSVEDNYNYLKLSREHYGDVSDVHFLKDGKTCVSAGCDNNIIFWDVEYLMNQRDDLQNSSVEANACRLTIPNAHQGWVWSISSSDNILVSTGWDGKMKQWCLNSSLSTPLYTSNYQSPVLSSCIFNNNLIAAGTWNQKIHLHDIRIKQDMRALKLHKSAVINIAANDRYIVSTSEHPRISIYDLVADKLFMTIKVKSTPLALAFNLDLLCCGLRDGNIMLVNPYKNPDDSLRYKKTFCSGHHGKINSIVNSWGYIASASFDQTIRIHDPTNNPRFISQISVNSPGELSCIDANSQNVLVSASLNNIHFWIPKN